MCIGRAFAGCSSLREVEIVGANGAGDGNTSLAAILGSPHHNEHPVDENGERVHRDAAGEIVYYAAAGSNFRGAPDAALVPPPITVRTRAGDEYRLDGLRIPAWAETARQALRDHPANDGYGDAEDAEANIPPAPVLPADLNGVLSAQHPGSALANPASYELLAAVGAALAPQQQPTAAGTETETGTGAGAGAGTEGAEAVEEEGAPPLKQRPAVVDADSPAATSRSRCIPRAAGSADAAVPLSPLIRGVAGAEGLQRFFRGELDLGSIVAVFVGEGDAQSTAAAALL